MRILLVRHGETAWNVEGSYQGQTFDIPLSESGRGQASALGSRLRGLVLARSWPAFCRACEGLGLEDTLSLVSHDGVNRVLLCLVLGLPLSRVWAFRQAPVCLNLLEDSDPDHLVVSRRNDASHCAPLFGEAVHRRL